MNSHDSLKSRSYEKSDSNILRALNDCANSASIAPVDGRNTAMRLADFGHCDHNMIVHSIATAAAAYRSPKSAQVAASATTAAK